MCVCVCVRACVCVFGFDEGAGGAVEKLVFFSKYVYWCLRMTPYCTLPGGMTSTVYC